MTPQELIDWHTASAARLFKSAAEYIAAANDRRSSYSTRQYKLMCADVDREMAKRHQETADMLKRFTCS